MFDFDEPGNYVAIRPSGTEPKIKLYAFGFQRVQHANVLENVRRKLALRVELCISDLLKFVEA